MKLHEGYRDIKVKLLDFEGNDLAKKCYEFGRYGTESYEIPTGPYNLMDGEAFTKKLIHGKTFPKMALTGHRITFAIEGISRICLAQLTRDPAIFCSESHGLRPLSMDLNIPLNLYNDKDVMSKFKKAQKLLEEAYIIACEKEYPYPETRYLGLHCQTISCTASYTVADFQRSCFSRTNNSFCDELNYVYRKMHHELKKAINCVSDPNSQRIWQWLINDEKCIDDHFYKRTAVFNGDFKPSEAVDPINKPETNAHNDWTKSCWKMELERMYNSDERYLLTESECEEIEMWLAEENDYKLLPSTYNADNYRAAKNAIKEMDYYGKG